MINYCKSEGLIEYFLTEFHQLYGDDNTQLYIAISKDN